MPLTDNEISEIARRVVDEIGREELAPNSEIPAARPSRRTRSASGGIEATAETGSGRAVFSELDQAIDAARLAQKALLDLGLAKRFEIIARIRETSLASAELWGQMAVEETGMGRPHHKRSKIRLAAEKTPGPEDLRPETFTGDHGITLVEPAPYGVVGVITPSTNPPATVVNNAISLVSAGNACIFNAHPAAKNVCRAVAVAINEAIVATGGPENLVTIIAEPTQETAVAMMKHRKINLLLVTGGMAVVRLAMSSGNRAICAGPGNPPAVVDDTAIIPRAARDLVAGAGFDNNILCTDEKSIFALDKIANPLKRELAGHGAFEVTGVAVDKLTKLLVQDDPIGRGHRHVTMNKRFIGKNVETILREIDLKPPQGTQIAIVETNWDHPLVMAEQLLPVIPFVRCHSFEEAMEWAIISEHQYQHTFVMHSTNVARLSTMAQRCNANIFVKNGANMAGLGFGGEGYCTMSIAGTSGEGLTKASTFTRPRRCTLVDYFRIV
ncbi:MAG: aldehyde dehydrogenase EutE [Acidobacteria bacterium]|nr:aldehyde dehydrogenase EutE [Acidobacteriota bacterium]